MSVHHPLLKQPEQVSNEEKEKIFSRINVTFSTDQLIDLQNEISDLHNKWIVRNVWKCSMFYGQKQFSPYSSLLDHLANRIEIVEHNFTINPELSDQEIVNGYKLYNSKTNIMCFSDFIKFKKLFEDNSSRDLSFEEFYKQFCEIACTEWAKMNANGDEWYGGFWKSENPEENKNAWNLTHKQNAQSLFDLPYSRTFLLETINFGCGNLRESVRYSNFLCVWVERKINLMNSSNTKTTTEVINKKWNDYLHSHDLSTVESRFNAYNFPNL